MWVVIVGGDSVDYDWVGPFASKASAEKWMKRVKVYGHVEEVIYPAKWVDRRRRR